MNTSTYPFITRDPIVELFGTKVEKKLTISDLKLEWLRLDYDGVSAYEELCLRGAFGIHEKKWRAQREFFDFVAAHGDVEKIALIIAADAVIEAMRLAGEDEETVEQYRRTHIRPAILKHLR